MCNHVVSLIYAASLHVCQGFTPQTATNLHSFATYSQTCILVRCGTSLCTDIRAFRLALPREQQHARQLTLCLAEVGSTGSTGGTGKICSSSPACIACTACDQFGRQPDPICCWLMWCVTATGAMPMAAGQPGVTLIIAKQPAC